ncbi:MULTISPECIES: hypothetical protein [unclassified Mesorhizobium]|uniref:hypothetical protein n=1 Tax=unclassified Mesorhizobium TaxID=325217 RepID=UPI000FCBCFC3|nr:MULTISPECIES: hypothetical protein [unclassified Mesorhizobium]RUW68148.1 hypothetical protein EOA31_26755 [Mesorhizobium sp. M4B.F.Ca.ET.049.02.1.2]TGV26946.1 hypothetical protein EN786_09030 [Mesorhizobium sp. M4B.F.Ca.ET.143.01.1.1]
MGDPDDVNFGALLTLIRKEIDSYDYQALVRDRTDRVGIPVPQERIDADLARFRLALVTPYWIDVVRRDTIEDLNNETPIVERCAVVTDDRDGYLLAYQPQRREFLLVGRTGEGYATIGVRGDPVGCYLAM